MLVNFYMQQKQKEQKRGWKREVLKPNERWLVIKEKQSRSHTEDQGSTPEQIPLVRQTPAHNYHDQSKVVW